jgi:hypothetical protein
VRERFSREGEGLISSGFSCSPRCQAANDKGERFANLWTPEENLLQVFPPSWSVFERRKSREREIG